MQLSGVHCSEKSRPRPVWAVAPELVSTWWAVLQQLLLLAKLKAVCDELCCLLVSTLPVGLLQCHVSV
jgi:hypothetical protein